MKKYIGLIVISLFLASCGGSNGPDLEIKEDTVKGTVGTVDTSIPAPELLQEIDTLPKRKRERVVER